MGEQIWIVDEDYEKPQKEMDFPPTALNKVPLRKASMHNLRINTYTKAELPDRYMSSEEEASPSPDSEIYEEEQLKHKTPMQHTEEETTKSATEPTSTEDYKAEIAVAVPIFVGRPKLVDITNLAPMHKRKRSIEQQQMLLRLAVKKAISRIPSVADENVPLIAHEAAKVANTEGNFPKRKNSLPIKAPDSWLPEDVTIVQDEEDGDHYFPDLELRKPLSYKDYDPYSLNPPRLSPKNSYSKSSKKPRSATRARNNSNTPIAMNRGWKGLTRSLGMAKKQTLHRGEQQLPKKQKTISRGADERHEAPVTPAFTLDEDVD